MAEIPLHPLDSWLIEKGQKPYQFAAKHGIGLRTIYAHLNGEVISPRVDLLAQIEKATGGDVTIVAMAEWFRKLRRPKRRKTNGRG